MNQHPKPTEKDAKVEHKHAPEKDAKVEHKHAPEKDAKAEEKGFQKLKVAKGTTEISHGGLNYQVAQGPAEPEGTVFVPKESAEIFIKQGGAVPVEEPSPPPEGTMKVKHVNDPKAVLVYGDKEYHKSGGSDEFEVPAAIVPDIAAHGFVPVGEHDGRRSK